MIIGIVVASIAGYLGIGAALTRIDLPRSIADNTRKAGPYTVTTGYSRRWGTPETERRTREHDEIDRAAVRSEASFMTWAWPIVAPVRAWRHGLETSIDRYDPAVTRALEADLDRLQDKINELKEQA